MAFPRGKKNLMSFNAGELSPKLDARVDTEKYSKGCRQCQNMIPMPHGGVTRRKGFEFIAGAKYDDTAKPVRLMDFQFSRTVSYILELGDLYMRFFTDGQPVMNQTTFLPYEIATPYSAAECAELQYVQINDVVYITHPSHAVRKLSRLANDSWTLTAVAFDWPPFLEENLTTTTIDPSGTTGNITMVASAAVFEAGHVGGYFRIGHRRYATSVETPITSAGAESSSIFIDGGWSFKTFGIWYATLQVLRSLDGSTNWEIVRSYTGTKDRNVDVSGDESEGAYYKISVAFWTSQTNTNGEPSRAVLEVEERMVYGVVQITAVTDSTNASGTVIRRLNSGVSTSYWSEGAWSTKRGFPTSCAFYEGRMYFAGSNHQPQTLWGSVVDDFENFDVGTADDDSVAFTLSSSERQQILWMVAQNKLVIGTTSGEWTAASGELESAITPTNIMVRQQSHFGSQATRALLVNDTILFVQRSGRKLREATYDSIKDGYQSNDLTILSDHITAGGLESPCYQSDRDSIFWAIASGNLVGMTYEKEQNVIAWHRHNTEGIFESVETIYGTLDDEVWVSVLRNIDGVQKRFIERMTGYYNPLVDDFSRFVSVGGGGGSVGGGTGGGVAESEETVTGGLQGSISGLTLQVAFLIDTTGSMGDIIEAVKTQAAEIASALREQYATVTFALLGFKDETDVTDPILDFTTYALWNTALDALAASGGGDTPENGYGTIVEAIDTLTWTAGVTHAVYLFTDAESHERGATKAEAMAALQSQNASFFYGPYNDADYDEVVTATPGGASFDSTDDLPSVIVQTFTFPTRSLQKTFVDSCRVYAGDAITVMNGLDHLEGEEVNILADGMVVAPQVVTGGTITLDVASSIIHVGLPFKSVIQPMRLDMDDQAGNTQGMVKQIRGLTLRLMDTYGLSWADAVDGEFKTIKFRNTNDNMDEAPPLFTGDKHVEFEADFGGGDDDDTPEPTFILKQDQPLPWTLIGAVVHLQTQGQR